MVICIQCVFRIELPLLDLGNPDSNPHSAMEACLGNLGPVTHPLRTSQAYCEDKMKERIMIWVLSHKLIVDFPLCMDK